MSTAILLEAIGIQKYYDKFAALGGVDLRVYANTVHSVIGPNGAGKTTLFHMLTGTKTVTAGRIVFDGHDVTHEPDLRRVQRGIARSFQVTSLFLTWTISWKETLAFCKAIMTSCRLAFPSPAAKFAAMPSACCCV